LKKLLKLSFIIVSSEPQVCLELLINLLFTSLMMGRQGC
jgi:hypothetical protein